MFLSRAGSIAIELIGVSIVDTGGFAVEMEVQISELS